MIIVTVARKPLSEPTVASNVLKHGTGALNIDASRIASDGSHMVHGVVGRVTAPAGDERVGAALGWGRPGQTFTPTNHAGGRWPANLILQHLAGCKVLGTRQVKGSPPTPSGFDRYNASLADHGYRPSAYTQGTPPPPPSRLGEDGTETVTAWECAPGCPVAGLDEQSGDVKGAVSNGKRAGTGFHEGFGVMGQTPSFGDAGGASRFFKQIKPTP